MCLSTTEEKINVVILYDTHAAGLRAMALHAQITRDLASECEPELNLWRFDMAIMPDLAPKVSRDLADADVIFIAVHGHQPGLELFSHEPEAAVPADLTQRRVLVVLLKLDGKPVPVASGWIELLRPIATTRRADFFTWGAQADEGGAAGVMREIGSIGVAESEPESELAGAATGEN
jgi:hypothetical protein